MQPSTLLLIASLGAISVLLMLYIYIFMFERRIFLVLWSIGWAIIALNYSLDAFLSDFFRQNRWVLFLSLGSYFYANLLISWGTLIFLKFKTGMLRIMEIGMIWLLFFIIFANRNWSDLQMIKYTQLAVFALSSWVGAAMVGSAKRYGNFISIIDSFDVMTHPQYDNPVKTKEEALEEIQRNAGTRFDPALVPLFIEMVNKNTA